MSGTSPGIVLIDFSLNQDIFCVILTTLSSATPLGCWTKEGHFIIYLSYQMLFLILQLWVKHLLHLINNLDWEPIFLQKRLLPLESKTPENQMIRRKLLCRNLSLCGHLVHWLIE